MNSKRHILLIGGAGYVGSTLADVLLEKGYRIRILDNFLYGHFHVGQAFVGRPRTSLTVGDLRDPRAVHEALDGVTDVVLLASMVGDPISRKYPDLTRAVNVDASKALFDTLDGRSIERFIFTSTCSNYGLRATDHPATEEAELRPLSPYAETKVVFEQYMLERGAEVDFTSVVLRLSTAFGLSPRMRFDLTVNEFANTAARGGKLEVYDKDTWRPYCHVRDIAAAVVAVLQAPVSAVAGEVFNVGSDLNNFTKAMIVDAVLSHADAEVEFVEGGGDARNYCVSFSKIVQRLGFSCAYDVPASIKAIIAAVRSGLYMDKAGESESFGNYRVRPELAGVNFHTSSAAVAQSAQPELLQRAASS